MYVYVFFGKCDKGQGLQVRRLWTLRLDGISFWLLSILYDFYPILVCLWVFKHNAICWLLWAGWFCYIFTVSVMINFFSPPHSLKQRSFTSPPLLCNGLLCQPALLFDFPPLSTSSSTTCFSLLLTIYLLAYLACFYS